MADPQRSVPATPPAPTQHLSVRPAAPRPALPRSATPAARRPSSAAPITTRRDPIGPGARPARWDGLAAARPVRGGCSAEPGGRIAGGRAIPDGEYPPPPLRLTERGRRVVAGLSIAFGLCLAAATVVTVEIGHHDGGLQLAGASTVVVQPGDTLWTIARSVAPEEDPRAVVDAIVDLNGLDGVDLLPGAELQLP